jgi:hypothetical protein
MRGMDEAHPGPLLELPIADLFGANESEEIGLQVLVDLARDLDQRQSGDWYILTVVPDKVRWLGRSLLFADDAHADWVELSTYIRSWPTPSWKVPGVSQRLWRVWTSLEVACWCEPDHGEHSVHELLHEAGSIDGFSQACAGSLQTIDEWIRAGPMPIDRWRQPAGLPTKNA